MLHNFQHENQQTLKQEISISGVGPRLALSLLSFFNPESLAMTIASGDIDSLSMVPGLGKRLGCGRCLGTKTPLFYRHKCR